jgi:ABC-type branched-subunit amino acid transport system substrate-binding protein
MILALAATSSPLSAMAEEPIRIGAPLPLTGPFASDGVLMKQAIDLAVKQINEDGGLLGRELTVADYDIGDLTPDKLRAAANALLEDEDVDVLIQGYGAMGPDIPAFCPYKQPYIHNAGTQNVVDMMVRMKCDNIFMTVDVAYRYGEITFAQLEQSGLDFGDKEIVLLHAPWAWEIDKIAGVESAAEKAGWTVVRKDEVNYGMSEWGGIINRINRENPDLIYLSLLDPDAVWRFLSQLNDNPPEHARVSVGYTISMPAFANFARSGGVDGLLGMTLHAQDASSDTGRAFEMAWKAEYDESPGLSTAAQVYDHVMLWADAVADVGDPRDFDAIYDALRNNDYQGVNGTFRFNDEQYINSSNDTIPSLLLEIQDAEVTPLMRGDQLIQAPTERLWGE